MTEAQRTIPMRRARIALGALVLAWVAWRVLGLGLADHHAVSDPVRALAWRTDHPEALLRAAERAAARPGESAALARRALRAYPLDGRGYRHLASTTGSALAAERLLAIAVSRAPRDLPGQSALAASALRRGDFGAALARFDTMLRVEPALLDRLYPALAALAAAPDARDDLARFLRARPPWRTALLVRLARETPDAASIAPLFERVRHPPGGLQPPELEAWLDRLAKDRQWGAAYLTWMGTLAPERKRVVGNVFNGGFEWPESGSGFDWRFGRVPGARIERSPIPGAGGTHALHVHFAHGRVPFHHVRQLLALPPGAYRFAARARVEALRSERGLVWTIACAEGGAPLGTSAPMRGNHGWRPLAFEFVVPTAQCGGQWLALKLPARVPAEQRIGGDAWFDDLQVTRLDPLRMSRPVAAVRNPGADADMK